MKWIREQFSAEISVVPDNITVGDVTAIYDKYRNPLIFRRDYYGVGLMKSLDSAMSLNAILKRQQLAIKPDCGEESDLSEYFKSPDISSHELFLELQRIKKENKPPLGVKDFLAIALLLICFGFALVEMIGKFFK